MGMETAGHYQDNHFLRPQLQYWDDESIRDARVGSSPMTNAVLRKARDSLGLVAEGFQWIAVKKTLPWQLSRFQT